MILQPCNVELTKVHYYDKNKRDRNVTVPTISREIYENSFNKNVIIKKNIFGHRWVLKINENDDEVKKKSKVKCIIYVLVFCCIIVAVCFGVIISIDHKVFRKEHKVSPPLLENINRSDTIDIEVKIDNLTHENQVTVLPQSDENYKLKVSQESSRSSRRTYCPECIENEQVCLKIEETEKPKCVQIVDRKDPTGCGGNCKINTEYCQLLDKENRVYQCFLLKHLLKCQDTMFNCGNMCIEGEKRCDGIIDCSNRSDEENCECDLEYYFQCGNSTSCLENSKMCDGVVDCWDKTDELNCKKAASCDENYIPCINGECIPKEKFCDGQFDCQDRTDEPRWCQKY